jgi:hypothetical protein
VEIIHILLAEYDWHYRVAGRRFRLKSLIIGDSLYFKGGVSGEN